MKCPSPFLYLPIKGGRTSLSFPKGEVKSPFLSSPGKGEGRHSLFQKGRPISLPFLSMKKGMAKSFLQRGKDATLLSKRKGQSHCPSSQKGEGHHSPPSLPATQPPTSQPTSHQSASQQPASQPAVSQPAWAPGRGPPKNKNNKNNKKNIIK